MDKENMIVNGYRAAAPRLQVGRLGALLLAALLACVIGASAAPSARADDFLTSFTAAASGTGATQAGAHPDVTTHIAVGVDPTGGYGGNPAPIADIRTTTVDLPPGLVGDPTAAPRCTIEQLTAIQCPTDTQIGIVTLTLSADGSNQAPFALYNMVPAENHVAEMGFSPLGLANVTMVASVRPDAGNALRLTIDQLPTQIIAIFSIDVTLWGVPADHAHDTLRAQPGDYLPSGSPIASGSPLRPFVTNPVACTGEPLTTRLTADSWQQPSVWQSLTATSPALVGCDGVRFDATATAQPTSHVAGAPTGLQVRIAVPQDASPNGIATGQLRRADVRLPVGTQISPSAADGLQACSDAQIAIGTDSAVTCPRASQVGTVSIDSPLLAAPLTGNVYLGAPRPGDPYRMLLVAQGSGVLLKLSGSIAADPHTGQLTATFDNNPQLPFRTLTLTLFGGPRAVLANPPQCGTFTTQSLLTPWNAATPTSSSDSFTVDEGCDRTFSPTFRAGMASPLAGAFTPFVLDVSRADGQSDLGSLAVTLPPGLLGRIASVPRCPEAAANAGTCAAASRVGSVTVAAGSGPSPFALPGAAYLTGPHGGGPYGLAIVVDATHAGPYDLGQVVVRAGIRVDRHDAHLTAVSDAFPTILQGIPLRLRSVRMTLDRRGFMFNPTRCSTMRVDGAIAATNGASSAAGSRFRAVGCSRLGYEPRLRLSVGSAGRRPTLGSRLPLTALLTQPAGQANSRSITVTLPMTVDSLIANLKAQCPMAAFDADRCPRGALAGTASAVTPVLPGPLRGKVWFVKNPKVGLPLLMMALEGDGVRIDLRGDVTTPHSRFLRTRFATIPDAPITRFRMALSGGANAPLGVAVSSLCTAAARAQRASVAFVGQNGAHVAVREPLHVLGCGRRR